jgi:hypothetical protein
VEALTPDNLLDTDKADALLRGAITRPKAPERVPAVLKTAKARKLRAAVALLQDQVGESRRYQISPTLAVAALRAMNAIVATAFRRLVDAAPTVAGRPPAEVHRTLADAANAALEWFQEDGLVLADRTWEEDLKALAPLDEPAADLDYLSPVELAALQMHLQAELLERELALKNGALAQLEDVNEANIERLVVGKSLFLAIPARVAQVVSVSTLDETYELLVKEVELACAALEVHDDGKQAAAE